MLSDYHPSWHTGSPYIDPKYQSPEGILDGTVFTGAKVLNVSQEELREEWNELFNTKGKSDDSNVVAIVLSVVFIVALLGAGGILGLILMRSKFYR